MQFVEVGSRLQNRVDRVFKRECGEDCKRWDVEDFKGRWELQEGLEFGWKILKGGGECECCRHVG